MIAAQTVSLLGVNVTFDNTQDLFTWTLALIAVSTALGKWVIMPVYRFVRRLDGVMTSVESQLYPNGGTTLRDAVDRIQKHLGIPDQSPAHDPNHHKEQP